MAKEPLKSREDVETMKRKLKDDLANHAAAIENAPGVVNEKLEPAVKRLGDAIESDEKDSILAALYEAIDAIQEAADYLERLY